jgi:glycosyltransferase involved in cell wall biosynthesis
MHANSSVSIIICTHNPRISYLQRVLEALRGQTLPKADWELLIIDNASDQPVRELVDLSWHPSVRYIREETLGIAHARFRGMTESAAELVVFMDDDLVPQSNYLEEAVEIGRSFPQLGAWSGQVFPEYETNPPEELRHYLDALGLRKLSQDIWGNMPTWRHLPWGGGMCLRRKVVDWHCKELANNKLRLQLGHIGGLPSCHEDTDIALSSLNAGFGTGIFRDLILTHLIPQRKVKESYLIQLVENAASAFVILRGVRGIRVENPPSAVRRWIERLEYLRATPPQKRAIDAKRRGDKKGRAIVADLLKLQYDNACPIQGQARATQ